MSRLAETWHCALRGRAIALALAVTCAGLLLSAAFPRDAQALIPLLIGGGAVVGLFASGVAGDAVLEGVEAILNWIYGGLKDTITPFVMEFLTRVDLVFHGGLERMVVPLVVIGAALMVLGAVSSVIQGYGAVIAGTASSSSVMSGVLMRIAGLALLLGAWHTVVPIAVDVANEFSAFVLTDAAVKDALAKTFGLTAAGGASAGIVAAGVAPIVMVVLLTALAICFLVLLLLKYVVIFAFALLYLGGPVMIGLGAFPGLGSIAINTLVRSLAILILIPLAWATVFAAWAAINSTLVSDPPKDIGAYALSIINGPGIFVASCLVVLGVTRALIKMATPLGAPLSLPGARLAMAAAGYKAAAALWERFTSPADGLPGAEAVAEHNLRYEGTPYHRAVQANAGPGVSDGLNLAVVGRASLPDVIPDLVDGHVIEDSPPPTATTQSARPPDTVDGSAEELTHDRPRSDVWAATTRALPVGSLPPEVAATADPPGVAASQPAGPDFDAARARIREQGTVTTAQVATALGELDDDERAYVHAAAEGSRSLQQHVGDDGDEYFREQIAAGIADGGTFHQRSHEHAAIIGAGSHQSALDALETSSDPAKRPTHTQQDYTEQELGLDWTEPVNVDDDAAGAS